MNAQTQSPNLRVTPNAQIPTEQSPALQQPLVAPFFVEDGEFSSTLILLNGTAIPTYADVAMHAPDGTTVAKQRIQFTPHSQQQLSMSSLRANGTEPNITTGSITVSQDPKPSGMTIVGGLAISQASTGTHHYIDEELAMPMLAMPGISNSQMLRGVADSSDGSPLVAIASLTTLAQHISILCVSGAQTQTSSVTVVPGQSLLVPACGTSPSSGADLHWYETNTPHSSYQAVGISLTTDSVPGSFAAFGLAPHDLPEGRYYSSISFADPKTQSSKQVFTGIPVGTNTLLKAGKYTPAIALANFSNNPRKITLRYALTQNSVPQVKTVFTISLPASSSRQITLDGLTGDSSLQDSFIEEDDGDPGDIQVKILSEIDSPQSEIELIGKDFNDPENGGNHPWTIENGTTSALLLFNQSDQVQSFNVEIAAGGTVWRKLYRLQPMQTQAININDLVKTGEKDDIGKAFPSDVWWGQVAWSVPRRSAGRGRLLQSNPNTAMARNFSCGWNLMACNAYLNLNPGLIAVGGTEEYATMEVQTCMNTCLGDPVGSEQANNYFWSSEDSSIASIAGFDGSGNVQVTGVGAGSTFIDGSAVDDWCEVWAQGVASVVPVITSISPSTIPIGDNGAQVTISGAGFGSSPTLNLPSGVSSSGQSSNGTSITVTLIAGSNSTVGYSNLSVTVNGQASNSKPILLDGPYNMVVTNDVSGNGAYNIYRSVDYQARNFGGTNSGAATFCELPVLTGWNCNQSQPTPSARYCPNNGYDSFDGAFTDTWEIASVVTPSGCGGNITDPWYWAYTSPQTLIGTPAGFIHSDAIELDNVTTPNHLSSGTVIPR